MAKQDDIVSQRHEKNVSERIYNDIEDEYPAISFYARKNRFKQKTQST